MKVDARFQSLTTMYDQATLYFLVHLGFNIQYYAYTHYCSEFIPTLWVEYVFELLADPEGRRLTYIRPADLP